MQQKGAGTLLLMAILIPALFYGTTVVLSLYNINARRGTLQNTLEQALIKGGRYLPDSNEAMRVAKLELQRSYGVENTLKIVEKHKSPYSIALAVEHNTEKKLAIPLISQEREIKYKESAQARVTTQPKDVYIFFENSSYLAPPIADIGANHAFYFGQSNKRDNTTGQFTRLRHFGYFETFLGVTEDKLLRFNSHENARRRISPPFGNAAIRQLMAKYTPHFQAADLFKDSTLQNGRLRTKLRRNNAITQAVLTQQCFNPIYMAMKKAAIHILDYFSISKLNRTMVTSGPISGSPPNLRGRGRDPKTGQIFHIQGLEQGGNPLVTGLAKLENNKGEKIFTGRGPEENFRLRVRDQECWSAMALATELWDGTSNGFFGSGETGKTVYALPFFPDYLSNTGLKRVGDPIPHPALNESTYRGDRNEIRFHYELDRTSFHRLRTREAIWARSIAENYEDETRVNDDTMRFGRIITDIINNFINVPTPYELTRLRNTTGESLKKIAYIFLGDTPHVSINGSIHNLRTAGNSLKDRYLNTLLSHFDRLKTAMRGKKEKLSVLVVIPRHETSYSQDFCTKNYTLPYELECMPFRNDLEILRLAINEHTARWKNVEIVTIPATDAGSLALDLLQSLISSGHGYILSDV